MPSGPGVLSLSFHIMSSNFVLVEDPIDVLGGADSIAKDGLLGDLILPMRLQQPCTLLVIGCGA